MPEIIKDMKGKDLSSGIRDEVKRDDTARQEYKRQCLINVMYLYGRHNFTITRNNSNTDLVDVITAQLAASRKSKKIRRTSNYILPLFRALYSRLIRQKANVNATPTTSTEKDRDAARVAKEVAEDFWQNCNRGNPWTSNDFSGMLAVLMKLDLYSLTIGGGYLIPYFNPKATTFVYDQTCKDVTEAEVGAAEVRVSSPLHMFRDRFGRHCIERRFISPEQVEYEFDKTVDPVVEDEDILESQISRLLDGSNSDDQKKEGVYVYTKYMIPTKKHPDGRLISCTDNELLADDPLPPEFKKRMPVVEFRYQDLGFGRFGQGAIEQVVDLQKDYDDTLTRVSQYKRNMTGKVLAPRGANLSAKYNDQTGQIIYYALGYKPTFDNGATIPSYFFKELERIRKDMEDMMNSHETSMGRVPTGVKSGIGMETLKESDNSQIAPELIQQEQKLGYFTEVVLDICQARYQERRLLSISGEDLAYEVKSFMGSDLFGQKRIQINLGTGLPSGRMERQAYIDNLVQKGYISQQRGKELMEFGDIEGIYKSLDETAAKQDILNIIEDNAIVIAEPWEDHTIHLKVINDFRKGSKYAQLDEPMRDRINYLAQQHSDYLIAEQEAAMKMGGQLPPAAQPQTQVL